MRLGGPVFVKSNDPSDFAAAHIHKGYRAAYCPGSLQAGDTDGIRAYRDAMNKHDIIIAEVGAWSNPLSRDVEAAKKAFDYVVERLTLADELEAKACVNIVGSWNESHWYGPCAENFSEDFFNYAVEVSRKIIDAVKPKRTKMTFEIMPYSFLDSAGGYIRFLKALDRKEAGIHFDPINCINCPRSLYDDVEFLKKEFGLLGDGIVSMHLKDLMLHSEPPAVHLEETPIGTGSIHYGELLKMIDQLPKDTPVMLEHLPDETAYDKAASTVRLFAAEADIEM